MIQATKEQILAKIEEYDRIIISRHIRPDGDAIGSTKGLKEILNLTYPEQEVYLVNGDYSDYLAFLGGEDEQLPDDMYKDALQIVIDTASTDRISNPKYALAKEIIKIDHHIDIAPYGDLGIVEDYRAASCEIIADFYLSLKDRLKINEKAATYIYTGLVTDTGRFRYRDARGDTLRCAAALLDLGVNTDWLYANLYLTDFDYYKFEAHVYEKMKITENGVAYIIVDKEMQEKFNLSREDASNSISCLDSIKGCLIWIAFIENGDSFRVRIRSRFTTCHKLGEKYRGGGHECACGATVYNLDEINALISDADAALKDYKANNEGWL